MSSHKFVISDPHFGHKNMALRRGFSSVEEHDEHLVSSWNSVVCKHDTVWILGDLTMHKRQYDILNRLNGVKFVVLGNHDEPQHTKTLINYVNGLAGMKEMKDAIFTHSPIHKSQLKFRYKFNVHGHVHENTLKNRNYINVSAEVIDFTPVRIDRLLAERRAELRNKPINKLKLFIKRLFRIK